MPANISHGRVVVFKIKKFFFHIPTCLICIFYQSFLFNDFYYGCSNSCLQRSTGCGIEIMGFFMKFFSYLFSGDYTTYGKACTHGFTHNRNIRGCVCHLIPPPATCSSKTCLDLIEYHNSSSFSNNFRDSTKVFFWDIWKSLIGKNRTKNKTCKLDSIFFEALDFLSNLIQIKITQLLFS